MSDLSASQEFSARVRIMQMVLGSLVAGPAFFAIIVAVMRQGRNFPAPATPIMTYIQIGFSVLCFIAQAFIPNLVVASGRRKIKTGTFPPTPVSTTAADLDNEERMLATLYLTQLIVRAAFLEGGVFALLIAYLIEGELVGAVVAGLFWLRIVTLFPTRDRVECWIETQRDMSE